MRAEPVDDARQRENGSTPHVKEHGADAAPADAGVVAYGSRSSGMLTLGVSYRRARPRCALCAGASSQLRTTSLRDEVARR